MADAKISALPSATTPLAGTEVLPVVQGGTTDKVSVANLTAGRAVAAGSLSINGAGTGANLNTKPNTYGLGTAIVPAFVMEGNASGGTATLPSSQGAVIWGTAASPTAAINLVQTNPSASSRNYLSFSTVANGTYQESFQIGDFGDIKSPIGNFVPSTAGKGVNFTANTGAAGKTSQLLNWYEEGTWTPTYYGAAGSAGSLAYAEQTGKYTRIGRLVTVTGTIILSNKGSWTGRVQIGGFPFTPTADQYTGQVELRNCTFTGNYVIMEIGRASTSFARFVIVSGLGANTQIDDTMTANNSGFLFTLTYMV